VVRQGHVKEIPDREESEVHYQVTSPFLALVKPSQFLSEPQGLLPGGHQVVG
jgi:hypothetical protein